MPTGVYERTEEMKAKMRESRKGKIWGMKGKKHSEKTKQKISKSRKGVTAGEKHHLYGKSRSEEVKQKISQTRKDGNYGGENHYLYGKKMSKKQREKLSNAHIGVSAKEKHPMWNPDREWVEKRRRTSNFMISCLARLLYNKNGKHTEEILGFTKMELMTHLEDQFAEGMNWFNHGNKKDCWSIDHIKLVSAFLKEGIEDPKIINALDNLQPMWFPDNVRKGDKYEG